MQNPTLPLEENLVSVFKSFTVRLKLACKILNTPKAIIILDNQIDIFNMEKNEVISICANICGDLVQAEIDEDKINTLVNELVYSN
ncbi:hypothetical protein ACM55F_10135 [Flavobacterium sp. XS2P12]|uniref:hypothetical protein n=1 Tax=Flavobacterium melibiosi TaxID=3398734 RepID=UPI003A85BAD3